MAHSKEIRRAQGIRKRVRIMARSSETSQDQCSDLDRDSTPAAAPAASIDKIPSSSSAPIRPRFCHDPYSSKPPRPAQWKMQFQPTPRPSTGHRPAKAHCASRSERRRCTKSAKSSTKSSSSSWRSIESAMSTSPSGWNPRASSCETITASWLSSRESRASLAGPLACERRAGSYLPGASSGSESDDSGDGC